MGKYRSQFGQDEWALTSVFCGKRDCYFIELGAGDGVYLSNTYVLEKDYGWTGLCIEPTAALKKLKRRRSCVIDPSFVAGEAGEIQFVDAGYFSGIAGQFSKGKTPGGRTRTVPATTLGDLLKAHGAPPVIQYLSLDTEGSEYSILKSFPFDEFLVEAMTVEHNNQAELKTSLRTLLESKGYFKAQSIAEEDWWVHKSIQDAVDPLCFDAGHWEETSRTRIAWIQRHTLRLKRLRARARRPKPIRMTIDVVKRKTPWLHRALRALRQTLRGLMPRGG